MGTPDKVRKAQERSRRATEGLKRFEFWLRPEHAEAVKRFIERLVKGKRS